MGLAHIRERRDFKAAAAKGRRFRNEAFTAQIVAREGRPDEGLRLGLTASRQTGTATERNRIRRRLRAAAETAATTLLEVDAPLDLVLVARREALGARFTTLADDISRALDKALRQTRQQMAQQQQAQQ